MIRWCSTVLGALGVALSYGIPACAQGAAKPEASSGSALFTLLVLFTPLIIIVFFMIPMMRKAKRNTARSTDPSSRRGEPSAREGAGRITDGDESPPPAGNRGTGPRLS